MWIRTGGIEVAGGDPGSGLDLGPANGVRLLQGSHPTPDRDGNEILAGAGAVSTTRELTHSGSAPRREEVPAHAVPERSQVVQPMDADLVALPASSSIGKLDGPEPGGHAEAEEEVAHLKRQPLRRRRVVRGRSIATQVTVPRPHPRKKKADLIRSEGEYVGRQALLRRRLSQDAQPPRPLEHPVRPSPVGPARIDVLGGAMHAHGAGHVLEGLGGTHEVGDLLRISAVEVESARVAQVALGYQVPERNDLVLRPVARPLDR